MAAVTGNRKYKDRLFRSVFQEKADLLSLYNALNDSCYENPEALEITTIDDVLYLGMKNDISFLVDDCLNLYEAQSTWNPNMPLRGLFYFSRLYAGYVETHNLDIYSHSRLRLPTPKYMVFYNGTTQEDELVRLRLSDSYEKQGEEESCLECVATVWNINRGRNMKLMGKCRKLYEYAYLVGKIRDFLAVGKILESAVDLAVKDCIDNGILVEYLTKHRAEVKFMILSEYNEELHLKDTYECGKAEGKAEERNRVNALVQILMEQNRLEDLKKAASDIGFQNRLLEEFGL